MATVAGGLIDDGMPLSEDELLYGAPAVDETGKVTSRRDGGAMDPADIARLRWAMDGSPASAYPDAVAPSSGKPQPRDAGSATAAASADAAQVAELQRIVVEAYATAERAAAERRTAGSRGELR